MGLSILKSSLFAAALGMSQAVMAATTFLTTSPYVAVYCGVQEGLGVNDCGQKETNTLGYYIVTEYYGPLNSINAAEQTVTVNGVSQIGSNPCPFVTSSPMFAIAYGYTPPSDLIVPACATYVGKADGPATSVVPSATSIIATGSLSVSHVPSTSIPMFHNAAVTPGPKVAMAAAGAVGVVAALM